MMDDATARALMKGISMEQLREEIERRRKRSTEKAERRIRHCDRCLHFIAWTKREDAPADYNPCAKGHQMSFRMPEDDTIHDPDSWGFYHRCCPDRKPMNAKQLAIEHARLQRIWSETDPATIRRKAIERHGPPLVLPDD